jgi:hypothetical protein
MLPRFTLPWHVLDHMDGMLKGYSGYMHFTSKRMIDHHDHPNANSEKKEQSRWYGVSIRTG